MPTLKPSDATWYIWGTRIISFTAHTPWTWITVKWLLSVIATNQGKIPLWSKTKFFVSGMSLSRKNRIRKLHLFWDYHGQVLYTVFFPFSSVLFSRSVLSDSLRPHELQHTRPPCPSPTPRVHSNSCPSSWWCHPAISSSVVPFSSCPQSLLASESFPMSQLCMRWPKYWCSASASFLAKNTQDRSPLEWTGWISLQSKGLSRVFSSTYLIFITIF